MADRILACMAVPSDAMIEAALQSWFASPRHLFSQRVVDDMRAALVAAGKAMGGDDVKTER